jgi:SAM-dependent methyltransferase
MLSQLRPSAAAGAELWEDHWRRFAAIRYDRAALRWDGILDLVDRRLGSGPMLEAGCGLGRYLLYAHDRGGDAVGIDFAMEPLQRIAAHQPAARLAAADLGRLPFADGTFDTILCLGVLEHFEHGAGEQAKELTRVLRPGGWLIVTVPYANRLKRRRARVPGTDIVPHGVPPPAGMSFYQHCFTRGEARALVEAAGCDVIKERPVSRLFWLLGGLSARRGANGSAPKAAPAMPSRASGAAPGRPARGSVWRAIAREAAYWGQWAVPGDLASHMIAVVGRKPAR